MVGHGYQALSCLFVLYVLASIAELYELRRSLLSLSSSLKY